MAGWIGVDLDGTMALYDGWKSPAHIGAPIDYIVGRINDVLAAGYNVKVMTARMSDPEQRAEFLPAWALWSQANFGRVLEATCCKDFAMIELWDDRVVAVEFNTGRFLSPSQLVR